MVDPTRWDPTRVLTEAAHAAEEMRLVFLDLLEKFGDEIAKQDPQIVRAALEWLGAGHLILDDNHEGPWTQPSVQYTAYTRKAELTSPYAERPVKEEAVDTVLESGRRRAVAKNLAAAMGCDWVAVGEQGKITYVRITAPQGYVFSRDYVGVKVWKTDQTKPESWKSLREYLLHGLSVTTTAEPKEVAEEVAEEDAAEERKTEQLAQAIGCSWTTRYFQEKGGVRVDVIAPLGMSFVKEPGAHGINWYVAKGQEHQWRELQAYLEAGVEQCPDEGCKVCADKYETHVRSEAQRLCATIQTEGRDNGLAVWVWAATGFVWHESRSHYLHWVLKNDVPDPRGWLWLRERMQQGVSHCQLGPKCPACQQSLGVSHQVSHIGADKAEPGADHTVRETWRAVSQGPEGFVKVDEGEAAYLNELTSRVDRFKGALSTDGNRVHIFAPAGFIWNYGRLHKVSRKVNGREDWERLLRQVGNGVSLCWHYPACGLCKESEQAAQE